MKKKRNVDLLREVMFGTRPAEIMSEPLKKYQEDVRLCLGMLLNGYSQNTIIKILEEDHGVKYSTAWRLIRETEELFGPQGEVDKRMKRMIASEMAQQSYEIAREKGNPRAMTAATNAFIKAWGLDRDDPDMPDFSKLDTPANILVIDEEVAKKLDALPAGGAVDLNNLLDQVVEDVEYEYTEGGTETGD